MRCQRCDYQLVKYARACPLCGRPVVTQVIPIVELKPAQTRLESWLARWQRFLARLRRGARLPHKTKS